MNIVTQINEWRAFRQTLQDKTIGFVPTMGNLHDGHLTLCDRSLSENESTIVSIFINPTQFDRQEDLDHYPQTLEQDIAMLSDRGVNAVLCPTPSQMYPQDYEVRLTESHLSPMLEGAKRPGHFEGMLTIVLKFFNLVQPTRAYFGEKDYQQLMLVKKMVEALLLPIKIIACETVRAKDGLALSSRNNRLNAEQRKLAALFPKILQTNQSNENIAHQLTQRGFQVDYITEQWQRRLGAVWIDHVRLIDNVPLT